jgi:methylenetetrahydrofolate reductase (NADPH)
MPSAPIATPPAFDGTVDDIKSFMIGCTYEATRPKADDIAALKDTVLPGSSVYVTMLPNRPTDELLQSSEALRNAGLKPVPHISVRHFQSIEDIETLLTKMVARARIDDVLLIGGDIAKPVGKVPDVLSVIESGALQRAGIKSVGVGGFPDGHPAVSDEELEASLVTKLASLQNGGMDGYIITQFCFHAHTIIRWLDWLRARGIGSPVKIGLAGPTSLMTWLNYARKCGVKASAEALASRSGLVRHAFKSVAPDPIIRTLAGAVAAGHINNVTPHLFAFGGIGATAKWAQPAIAGRIRLNADRGFDAI